MSENIFKILILADSRAFHTERIVEQLKIQNCEVLTLSLEKGEMEHVDLQRRLCLNFLHYRLAVSEIKKNIDKFQPDIVNAHYATGYGYIAALALRNKNIPLILNLWGSDILRVPKKSFFHKRKAMIALGDANYIIADSQYLLDEAYKIFPFKNSALIYWGIEKEMLDFHKKSYAFNKPLRIIVPRPHEEVYRNEFIIESLADLLKSGKIKITFPSWGLRFNSFKQKAVNISKDNIFFYEKMNRKNYLKYFASHDLYLSNAETDSSPVSLIEAMALGLIPITADIEGVKEWLGVNNGFRFKEDNSLDLQNIITKITNSDNLYDSMRKMNLEKVKEKGLFEKNIKAHLKILKEQTGING